MTVAVPPRGSSRRGQPGPTPPAGGCLLPSSALPPTGRMVPPRSPPDPSRAVWLQLEVAAVAAVITEAGSSGRGDLTAQKTGAPSPAYPSPPPSCCNCQSSAWNPEGQLLSRPRGPEQGSRGSGSRPLRLTPAPAPRAELVSLPPSSGKGQADAPLDFPSGSDPFHTENNSFPWAPD
ncbi:proline-rich protein 2-like [Sapajus apella]|uniref:Proline-rich protein 2-like n=1 Tax=Sapajus apella TaxID=9515 RepID=A0A6J3GZB9_SAPAP|nr:proline-rich protein 2-like [Sapajus apella]